MNLGPDVHRAVEALRPDSNFAAFREGLGTFVQTKINEALSSPVEQRVEATAYARALRDFWVALEGATLGIRSNQVRMESFTVAERIWLGVIRDNQQRPTTVETPAAEVATDDLLAPPPPRRSKGTP